MVQSCTKEQITAVMKKNKVNLKNIQFTLKSLTADW